MNPIFSRNPMQALAIARALGAVQGPENAPKDRMRAFLELAGPARTEVLDVEKWEADGRVRVTKVSTMVLSRVGRVHIALHIDVMPSRGVGITDTDPQHTERLLTSWTRASLYTAPHPPADTHDTCGRCKRFRAVLRGLGVYAWLVVNATPNHLRGTYGNRAHGLMLEAGVRLAIARNYPQFPREARRTACEVAWQTAKEKETEKGHTATVGQNTTPSARA